MGLFRKNDQCPKCGEKVKKDAKFCKSCGTRSGKAELKCASCDALNTGDAKFCNSCGVEMRFENKVIKDNTWRITPDIFAIRVESDDVKGFFKKGLVVEQGTRAVFLINGRNDGVVGPGKYDMETLFSKIANISTAKKVTALVIDENDLEVPLELTNIHTSDPIGLTFKMTLVIRIEDPVRFTTSVMRGKDTYNVNDLKQYLFGELKQMLDAQVINYTAEQLHANPEIKDEFELAIQDELRISLERAGMGFDRLRLLSCYHEQMDKTRKIREKYFLMVSEQQAGNEGIKRLFDEKNKSELEEIRQLGIKADNHEQRIEAFAKWRKFVNADEMNKLKTVDDLEAHEHKLGIGKRERDVLGEDQIDVLRRSLEMEGEEKAIVHRHFKQRLESEHQIAQKRYEAIEMLKLGLEVDESKVDHTLTQQKKMLDAKLDAELKQYQQDKIKRDDSLKEWEKVEEIKRKKEEEKRRISREDDLMRDQAVHELKMEELEKMSEASAEALIAMADSDKAILLADLQKTEALKGMSEDQILAMASENSPEVAKAFQEKFKAIASKEYQQEKDVMNKDMMDRMHEMFNKALETQRDTASSFAHGQGVNVAYPPAGGQPVVANAGGIVGGVILCPSCRRQVPQDAMFCDNCGKKIRE